MTADDFARSALERGKIVVCVGSGGVGKTTIAAALALEAARRHRNVAVITIDPARRLADALGVHELGNEPQAIPRDRLDALGVPADGALSAMMLDMKRTFDDLVERFAEDETARDRVLANPIYRHISDALAGSVEYSAMEKVYQLCEGERFDLVVVDTPPSQHALDFLDAPQRMVEFLDSRIVQILIHPAMTAGRIGFKVFQRGARKVLQLIERVSGIGFLEDISEFLMSFEQMSEAFRDRAVRVRALLLGPQAAFVLVAGPARESALQAEQLHERLVATEVPLRAVLINRAHRWPMTGGDPPLIAEPPDEADLAALAAALTRCEGAGYPADAAARAAVAAATGYAARVRSDTRSIEALKHRTRQAGRYQGTIPELEEDVHDLDSLGRVADMIFRSEPRETR